MKILAGMTAILGFLAVALGAFGAHALKNSVPLEMIGVLENCCSVSDVSCTSIIINNPFGAKR